MNRKRPERCVLDVTPRRNSGEIKPHYTASRSRAVWISPVAGVQNRANAEIGTGEPVCHKRIRDRCQRHGHWDWGSDLDRRAPLRGSTIRQNNIQRIGGRRRRRTRLRRAMSNLRLTERRTKLAAGEIDRTHVVDLPAQRGALTTRQTRIVCNQFRDVRRGRECRRPRRRWRIGWR